MENYNSVSLLSLDGFNIISMEEKEDDGISYVQLNMKYTGEIPDKCPECGVSLYKHGERDMTITDTPLLGKPAKINLSYPRKRCNRCHYMWAPSIDAVNEKRHLTERAYRAMTAAGIKRSFEDVGAEYGVNAKTARNVFVDYLSEKKDTIRFKTPMFLGLDEIKIKKLGEVTVITDLEHKTLYDMIQGRDQNSLTDYFAELPNAECVLWVCTDMYRPFEKTIRTALPNARWVIDHFHIVAYANRALDTVRLHVQSKLAKRDRIKTKKGLAYTLRTRAKDIDAQDAAKIRACRNDPRYSPLAVAFDLKEDFFNIYDDNMASKESAMKAFDDWEMSIPSDPIYESFRDLAKTVHNFYEQIFNFWDCPIQISNGFTECTNRIIRENNVKGRGNSFEVLRGRTLYRQANLDRAESSGMLLGPVIPKKGPVFHFEETSGEDETSADYSYDGANSFEYDPLLGLVPYKDFDPETGEIFEEYDEDTEI